MRELDELIERCAVAAIHAQVADLISLAQLHSDLQSLLDHLADHPAALAAAQQAADLVEKIVLGEASDPADALQRTVALIDQLESIIGIKGLNGTSVLAGPPAGETRAVSVAEPLAEEERPIAEIDLHPAAEFVVEATGHLDVAEASLLKLEEDPSDVAQMNTVFRAFHTIKGVAGFLEFKQIGALAHATETLLDLARKGKLQLSGARLDVVLEARDMMKQLVGDVDNAAKTKQAPGRRGGLPELLDRLAAAAQGAALLLDKSKPGPPPAAPAAPTQQSSSDATVKVATTRLDALINTVGELVIAQAMVAQDLGPLASDQRLARNLSQLGKITRSLQDLSMSMRMVPIAGVFQKMARLARDTSRKAGKDIEFSHVGGETELDRNVVEVISDPLIHMVRNAIDHGLEPPEDRQKAGKPRAGKLMLMACHQAGNVVIEISDDGRGLPREKIVEKAIAAGIIHQGQELTEQDIFQLIFHPGLSTAETVTDISGRGVGMDVVKKNVDALRGRIEIASTPGNGSSFTVRLPLTLAVIDGLIVKVGTQRYIIPITSIEQSLRPTPDQLSSVQGKGELCRVRDRLLPIVRLHKLFDIQPRTDDPTKALVVIVQEGSSRCCLLVDELIGQQQVVIKSVGKEIGSLPGFAGCAILGDGNVSLILDVAGLIHSALRRKDPP